MISNNIRTNFREAHVTFIQFSYWINLITQNVANLLWPTKTFFKSNLRINFPQSLNFVRYLKTFDNFFLLKNISISNLGNNLEYNRSQDLNSFLFQVLWLWKIQLSKHHNTRIFSRIQFEWLIVKWQIYQKRNFTRPIKIRLVRMYEVNVTHIHKLTSHKLARMCQ